MSLLKDTNTAEVGPESEALPRSKVLFQEVLVGLAFISQPGCLGLMSKVGL